MRKITHCAENQIRLQTLYIAMQMTTEQMTVEITVFNPILKTLTVEQGCCLTGAWSLEVPKLWVRATKVLLKEPVWAPKCRVFIPN